MAPVKTRMNYIYNIEGLDENEIDPFVVHRLKAAKAPDDLVYTERATLISSNYRETSAN